MSMEIRGNYGLYKIHDAVQIKAEQGQEKEVQERKEEAYDKRHVSQDEYISGKKTVEKPAGLYRLEQDENGKPKVVFDTPEKAKGTDKEEQPKISSDTPEKTAKICTTNTDKVDREIEKLKEKKQQLEQQIQAASGNEKKVQELEKKLAQVESELRQKDNDTYRRQQAEISER